MFNIKKQAFAAWNTNLNELKESTSGGTFYILAKEIINKGGYVVGAIFTNNFLNLNHIITNDINNVKLMRKSKYAFSETNYDLFDKIRKLLIEDKLVFFSGLPCQIGALEYFLKRKNINYEKLITFSLICYGCCSFKILRDYLTKIEEKYKSRIKSINFRDKEKGWNSCYIKIIFEDNAVIFENIWENSFMKEFCNRTNLRKCCYNCQFKNIETLRGDIIAGDFWGVEKIYSNLFNENRGISLIILNNPKKKFIIDMMQKEMNITEVDFQKSIFWNPMLLNSAKKG